MVYLYSDKKERITNNNCYDLKSWPWKHRSVVVESSTFFMGNIIR